MPQPNFPGMLSTVKALHAFILSLRKLKALIQKQSSSIRTDILGVIVVFYTWHSNFLYLTIQPRTSWPRLAGILFLFVWNYWKYIFRNTHLRLHSKHCTMGLSPLKSCIKEIEQSAFFCSHFLEISLFQTKYLENILYSVSLLIYIWGLVEHGHMQKNDFQKNQ